MDAEFRELPIGKGEILRQGNDVAIMAIGSMVAPALEQRRTGATAYRVHSDECPLYQASRCGMIVDLATRIKRIVTMEENTLCGGFGNYVTDVIKLADIGDVIIRNIGIPDVFVEHGGQTFLRAKYGLDAKGIVKKVLELIPADSASKIVR